MNKKEIINYLEQLELSELEAKLYLTLLETGPINVKELAEMVEIKRTTAYVYIDDLVEKGLIIRLVKGAKKLIAAIDPKDSLHILVEKKVEKAKKIQEEFPKMLKIMTSSLPQESAANDAEIRYYKGKAGVKKIYEEVLLAKEQRSYVDITSIAEYLPENFQLFGNAFKFNPDVKMFEIFQNASTPESYSKTISYLKLVTKQPNYAYKILPEGVKLNAQDILIYDDNVAIISFTDTVTGVVMQNRDLYNNFKILFDLMWQLLPENSKD